jgi:hypothetical protein
VDRRLSPQELEPDLELCEMLLSLLDLLLLVDDDRALPPKDRMAGG